MNEVEIETEIEALAAKNEQLKTEIAARSAAFEEETRKRNAADAKAIVAGAVKRGVLSANDHESIATWEKDLTKDPSQARLLTRATPALSSPLVCSRSRSANGVSSNLSSPLVCSTSSTYTPGSYDVTGEDPRSVFSALGKLSAKQAKCVKPYEKAELAKEFGAIYSAEFSGANSDRLLNFPLSAIVAGDVTDSNLHTLSGSLVAQRTLQLLKFVFPVLTRVSSDFSDQPAQFNQTLITRTITVPAVSDYNTSTGWTDSTATTTDVPITINKHQGVPITFNQNILASTARRLFDEFAPASAYSLGKAMVDDLYTNITDANFTNNTVSTDANFLRTTVVSLGTQLTLRGVPPNPGNRTLLLYPTVFQNLVNDPSLVTFAAYQAPEIITGPLKEGSMELVIPVDTFSVISAPNLPQNNGNISGFGMGKSALVIATRAPNDYTSVLPGASFGNVQMITDPDIGITVLSVQYVNHQLGSATQRLSLMFGTAAGDGKAGQLVKAASGSGSST